MPERAAAGAGEHELVITRSGVSHDVRGQVRVINSGIATVRWLASDFGGLYTNRPPCRSLSCRGTRTVLDVDVRARNAASSSQRRLGEGGEQHQGAVTLVCGGQGVDLRHREDRPLWCLT